MKKKYNDPKQQKIVESILAKITPMLEGVVNEISSTKFFDAADKADYYRNTSMADMFRDAGNKRMEIEKSCEYDSTVEELCTITLNNEKYIMGIYVPHNIKFIAKPHTKPYMAIARVTAKELKNIKNPEILSNIASYFGLKPMSTTAKDQVHVIGASLEENKTAAQKLANVINNAFETVDENGNLCRNTDISYRQFMGSPLAKRNTQSTEINYKLIETTPCQGKMISVVKPTKADIRYNIFYIVFADKDATRVMRIYQYKSDIEIWGHKKPLPIWKAIKNQDETGRAWKGYPAPTPDSSNIINIYDMFNAMTPSVFRDITNTIFRITNINIYHEHIDHAYRVETGEERPLISPSAAIEQPEAETTDDTNAFMDL